MEESRVIVMKIIFRSGRRIKFNTSDMEIEWLFDKLFRREEGDFQNFSNGIIVSIKDIEYLEFHEEDELEMEG